MTKDQEIKEIEAEIWSIFRKDYIPRFLAIKGSALIEKWKILTEWKTDNTPVFKGNLFFLDDEV
jgi:hypothetical protein